MERNALKSSLVWFALVFAMGCVEADELDNFVAAEVARLSTKYAVEVSYRIDDEGRNTSEPNGDVHFSRAELETVRSMGGGEVVGQFLIRFIVGHEMAHQWQYREYGKDVPLDLFVKRLYECQADMLAAADLAEEESLLNSHADEMGKAIQVLSQLGSENNVITDHPSGDERRLAFQYGLLKGILLNQEKKQADDAVRSVVEIVRKSLDWRANQTIGEWSLELSRRITHQESDAASSVAVGEVQRKWNKNANTPFVSYSVPYTNLSSRPLHVELQVLSVAVPRYSSSDISRWQRVDSFNHELDLMPRETKVITGILQWFAAPEWMPRLIVPPERNSLYAARFLDNNVTKGERSGSGELALTAINLQRVISRYLGNSDQGYQDFIAVRIPEHLDFGDGQDSYVFPSALRFPGAVSTDIWHVKDEAPYVRTQLYKGYSKDAALKKFDSYNELLSESYSKFDIKTGLIKSIIAESAFNVGANSKLAEHTKSLSSVRDRFFIRVRVDSKNIYTVSGTLERKN